MMDSPLATLCCLVVLGAAVTATVVFVVRSTNKGKAIAAAGPARSAGRVPRDIPRLYPDYFRELLTASGTPVTPTNMARLVERTAVMIGGQGAAYCARSRDPRAFKALIEAFGRGGRPERRLFLVDDMVDWLWAWNPTCHDDLRGRFPKWRRGLLEPDGFLASGGDIGSFFEDEDNPDYESVLRAIYAKNLRR